VTNSISWNPCFKESQGIIIKAIWRISPRDGVSGGWFVMVSAIRDQSAIEALLHFE
jgi:hypothetical protein